VQEHGGVLAHDLANLGNVVDGARRRGADGTDWVSAALQASGPSSRDVLTKNGTKPFLMSSSIAALSTSPRSAYPSSALTGSARNGMPRSSALLAPMLCVCVEPYMTSFLVLSWRTLKGTSVGPWVGVALPLALWCSRARMRRARSRAAMVAVRHWSEAEVCG
jgi:hypothetical protein